MAQHNKTMKSPNKNEVQKLITLYDAGSFDELILVAHNFTKKYPKFGFGWLVLGISFQRVGKMAFSIIPLQKAEKLISDDPQVHYYLGVAYGLSYMNKEAENSYKRVIKLNPQSFEAWINLGVVQQNQNNPQDAEISYLSALKVNDKSDIAYNNLGNVCRELNKLADAEIYIRKALEINPNTNGSHQNLATVLAYLSNYDDVIKESNEGMKLCDDPISWEQRLYALSYHPDLTDKQIYEEFVRWGDRFHTPLTDFSKHDKSPNRKLRIGYVSPDFRAHTSRFFFWPLFSNHDKSKVEIFAYSNVAKEDADTQMFKGLFDHWRNIRGVSDIDVKQAIRDDKIDILVDCCNHMRDDRLGVFALKPAPIQVTWLGAAWTTGLKTVDYALIDPYMAPEGTLTREEIVRLPSFVAFAPLAITAEIAPPPCLKNGYITYGYSGRTERLNHHTFKVWGEILKRNPKSRLILDYPSFADPLTQEHYKKLMIEHGMNPDQVTMKRSVNIFEGLNDIDVLLDSFPHSGGTMLFDALWMGVPILTLSSRPPVGRIGTSLMTNLGLDVWVAKTHEEYIYKAGMVDFESLAVLRKEMRARMGKSPLMDGVGFARAVEEAYRVMFNKWSGK